MYKVLIKDTALYSLSTLLARGFSLITVPIFTRILSPSDYGALDLLSYLAVILGLLIGLALDQAVGRFYTETDGANEKRTIASTVLLYNLVAPIPLVFLGAAIADKVAKHWLGSPGYEGAVMAAFVYVWTYCVFFITTNQLRYRFEAKKFALCSVSNALLSMGLSLWFVVSLKLGVEGVLLAQSASMICNAVLAWALSKSSYGWTFSWTCFKTLATYSLPLVPSTMAFFASQYLDRYVLNELRGLHEVGLYGIGARLASLVLLFLTGFQGAWYPLVMQTYKDPGAADKFRRVLEVFMLITSTALIWISVFSKEILLFLTTKDYAEAYIVVPLLLAAAVVSSVGNYFTYGIQIAKESKLRLKINLVGVVGNLVLNVILIHAFGFLGAAIAAFASALFIAVASMQASQRFYFVPYEWGRLVGSLAMALVVSYVVATSVHEISWIAAMAKMVAALTATAALIILLRVHDLFNGVILLLGRPS